MCRKRGRIVLVGVCGLNISRDEFYKKELSFQVSCSYGPGRYDPRYEEQGIDYPLGFVRWTEQRNFEAVLDLMAAGQIDARPLVSHRFPIERASQAYQIIGGKQPSLGVLLEYPEEAGRPAQHLRERTIRLDASGRRPAKTGAPVVAFVGAGNYASQVLIPAFRRQGACLHRVTSNGGLTAAVAARRFPFAEASSDLQGTLEDTAVDAVVIATRHDTHAQLACDALAAGKHVFVENRCAQHDRVAADPGCLSGRSQTRRPRC